MSTNLFGNFSVSINVTTLHYGSGKIFQIRGVIVLNKIVLIIAKSAEIINIFDKLQEIFQEATELLVLYLSAAVLHKQECVESLQSSRPSAIIRSPCRRGKTPG